LLAAALLVAGMPAQDALALGLGALKTKSALGEPFRAEISMLGDNEAVPASHCFTLNAPSTPAADDLPWLTGARVRTQGRSIVITSRQSIHDPILMLGVKIGCGFELAREYAVLMQPARAGAGDEQAVPGGPSSAAATGIAASAMSPAPPAPTARALQAHPSQAIGDAPARLTPKAVRKPRSPKHDDSADRLLVAPNLDTAGAGTLKMSAGLSRRPKASEAQREALRTEQRLLATLDEQITTHLAIADKVRQLEAGMADLKKQLGRTEASMHDVSGIGASDIARAPAKLDHTAAAAPSAAGAATQQGASAVPPPLSATPAFTEPAGGETGASSSPQPSSRMPATLAHESVRVIDTPPPETAASKEAPDATDIDGSIAILGALTAGFILIAGWAWRRRMRKLSSRAALRSRHAEEAVARAMMDQGTPESHDAIPYTTMDGSPAHVLYGGRVIADKPEPANAPDGDHPDDEQPDHDDGTQAMPPLSAAAAGTDAAVLAVDFELDTPQAEPATPARLDLELELDSAIVPAGGPVEGAMVFDADRVPQGPRLVSSSTATRTAMNFDQNARPANEETPPSSEHVLELAEIMMSFGRAEGAALTLSEFLRDYPKESIIPWLKLLDLYHSNGQRGEYDDLAPRLSRAFNATVPDWEHFDGPDAPESVEQFSHIMTRIHASWPNQDCLDYLAELLRDNRAGTRIGFPLGVIDDILLLKAVLEWLIANPSITETQTSRLALL
jgi:hypothetical protein